MDAFRPFGSPGSLPDAPRKNLEKRRVELLEFTDVSTQFPQGISWPCFSPSLCCGHLPFNQVVCTARKRIVERTHPQPPDPQSETGTLATHSGKSFQHRSLRSKIFKNSRHGELSNCVKTTWFHKHLYPPLPPKSSQANHWRRGTRKVGGQNGKSNRLGGISYLLGDEDDAGVKLFGIKIHG